MGRAHLSLLAALFGSAFLLVAVVVWATAAPAPAPREVVGAQPPPVTVTPTRRRAETNLMGCVYSIRGFVRNFGRYARSGVTCASLLLILGMLPVKMAVIDSGVDGTHPAFLRPDGSSRMILHSPCWGGGKS